MDNNEQQAPHGGGPQTDEGKATSRFNAMKHGMLRDTLTEYEKDAELDVLTELRVEFSPQNALESILLERIAVHYVKLNRITKAENEFVRSVLDPRVVVTKAKEGFTGFDELVWSEQVVERAGYTPKVGAEAVERLYGIYARYETNVENRLIRAIRELRELRRGRTIT